MPTPKPDYTRHACAVCPKPIRHGFLMCMPHWRLVPIAEQREVLRTYGVLCRAAPRSGHCVTARHDYYAARDRAVASAKARIDQQQLQTDGSPA